MVSRELYVCVFFFFTRKTAYDVRCSDCSSDVCSSDLVGLSALAFAAIFHYAVGWAPAAAVVAGLALSLSSTAIALQPLEERHLMGTPGGRAAFSILLFQDIAVIPMLALLPLLAEIGRAHV